jgi:multidrug efflux system membrane fusion protein
MKSFFRLHRVAAFIVLAGAVAWIATGEFAAVGSEEAQAASSPEAGSGQAEPAVRQRTVAAISPVMREHARQIRVAGSTVPDKRAVLAARSNGIVAALGIAEGKLVAADTLVLSLEGPDAAADVATAEANLSREVRELTVAEELFSRGSLPELQLTIARTEKAQAEAQVKTAQAAADRLTLRAPFSGIVETVEVELGEWVQAGTAVATLLSLDPIVVRAEVSELDVTEVRVGDPARVRLLGGDEIEGTIRKVANEASAQTRTFAIEISLPNAHSVIPAGLTAEVTLLARPMPAVTVPRSVVTLNEDGLIGLRIVGPDNVAHFAPVRIVDDTTDGLVVSGVPEGVRIIVAGQDLVRDGESVVVTEAAASKSEDAP